MGGSTYGFSFSGSAVFGFMPVVFFALRADSFPFRGTAGSPAVTRWPESMPAAGRVGAD